MMNTEPRIDHQESPERAGLESERLSGLDLARGLAYLGMVVVNFHLAMTWGRARASLQPEIFEGMIESLFGRAAAAFVLIAGVGLSLRMKREYRPIKPGPGLLISRIGLIAFGAVAVLGSAFHATRAAMRGTASIGGLGRPADWGSFLQDLRAFAVATPEGPGLQILVAGMAALGLLALFFLMTPRVFQGPRGPIFLRGLFLLAVGYLWQPAWSGDILHFYGLWLILALPLLRAPTWLLGLITLLLPILVVGVHTVMDYGEHWTTSLEHGGFWTGPGQLRDLAFDGWHPLLPWFGFLVAGLILGRCQLSRRLAPFMALALGCALVAAAPPLSRLTTAAVIEATTLGPGFEAEPIADEPRAVSGHDDGPAPRPDGPLFMGMGLPIDHANELNDPAAVAGARFLARELTDDRIEALGLEPDQGTSRLVVRLRRGSTQADQDAVVIMIQRWLLGLEGAERPAWPVGIPRVEVAARDRQGAISSVLIDTRDPGPLHTDEQVRILFGLEALPPGPFYFLQALGSALALVGLCCLLGQLRFLQLPLHPFVQTGRMAFTLYLLHVILGMGLLDQLKLIGGQGLPLALTVISVVAALSLAFSCAWLAVFRAGPIEALMRHLAR